MEDLHKSLDRKKTDKNAKKEMKTPKVRTEESRKESTKTKKT